jgi:excisionase family DNA binding protein
MLPGLQRCLASQRSVNYSLDAMVDDTPIPGYLTVAQAASRLGVTASRVRQLISQHGLSTDRMGGSYLVRLEDVERRAARAPGGGRRLTTPHVWGILQLAVGQTAPWLDRTARYRLRVLLRERGLSALRHRLVSRGSPTAYRAHPSQLEGLRTEDELMLSGPTAAAELRLGLLAGDAVDGYVDARDVEALVRRHHLRRSRDPNVTLRVVPTFTDAWPLGRHAPLSAIALDLLDDPDPRTRQLGEDLLARVGP